MFCTKCGSEISNTAKFCSKCGEQVIKGEVDKLVENKQSEQAEKKKSCWSYILSIVVFLIVILAFRGIGHYLGKYSLLLFMPYILGYLGWLFGGWYMNKANNEKGAKVITWLNLITWLIPIIGFFNCLVTWRFRDKYGHSNKLYVTIGIISFILNLINMIAGVVMVLINNNYSAEEIGIVLGQIFFFIFLGLVIIGIIKLISWFMSRKHVL